MMIEEPNTLWAEEIGHESMAYAPNEVIAEIYTKSYVTNRAGNPVHHLIASAIPYDQGMMFYKWICRTKPKRTLEVGMAYGLSTLFICQAHADIKGGGRHYAIDPYQSGSFDAIGLLNVQRAHLDHHLTLYEAPSYEVLPQLLEARERFEFIFIDGMHVFDYTLVDFFYADRLLEVGGYLVFDDPWLPSVRKVLMYVLRNRSYQFAPQLVAHSSSLWRRSWNFIRHQGKKRRIDTNTRQFIQNPFDLLTYFYLLRLGIQAGVKYWSLQKTANDNHPWDYHVAF